jgi:ribosomal protein S6
MADKEEIESDVDPQLVRVYETGYHILPTVPEDDVEQVVSAIRSSIESGGGSFISEGAAQSVKLAYSMYVNRGGTHDEYDRAYFGWIKFEAEGKVAVALNQVLDANENILRYIIFKTVREDTRASARPTTLREVKRTDTIKSTPKKGAEKKGTEDVSEKDLDKVLEDLTKE